MKFTEEQYQKIVDAWDNQILYKNATQSVIDELRVGHLDMCNQALALANPVTREWAHEQFVEEEKRYAWTLKKLINVVSECVYTKNILEVFNHFFL